MKFHRFFLFSGLFTLLMACTSFTKTEVDQQLSQLNQLSLKQMINLLGVPSKQYELDEQLYVEWHKVNASNNDTRVSIGSSTGGRNWFGGLGFSFPFNSEEEVCIIRATTDDNKESISNLDWRGNKDYCGELLTEIAPENKEPISENDNVTIENKQTSVK